MDAASATLLNSSGKSPICSDVEEKETCSSFPNVAPRNIDNQSPSPSYSMSSLVRFGSTIEVNEASVSMTTHSSRRSGSLNIISRASFVNGESTQINRRAFRLQERSILEIAAVIIGSLDSDSRAISCKFGQCRWESGDH